MTHEEQITHFAGELDALIARYSHEYDLSYASIIGILFMTATMLSNEALESDDDEDESPA